MRRYLPVVLALALLAVFIPVGANGRTITEAASAGRPETCTLDAQSGCTVSHGFDVKPDAVLVTNGGATLVAVHPNLITDKTYRVDFRKPGGGLFAAGVVARFNVHYDLPAGRTPTPSPTASPSPSLSPSPSPSPTSTASPVKTCADPSFVTVSTDNMGEGRDFPPYYLHNNMWNNHSGGGNGPAGRYEMRACGADNWYELVTQADSPEFAVRAYPNVHKDYADVPVTQVQSARFAHNTTHVPGMRWNVAFDVWMAEGSNGFANELMIWTEWQEQTPAGDLVSSSVVIGGVDYELWRLPGGQDIITFRAKSPVTHGTMPLQDFFNDLKQRGWILQNATTWQVDYGVEVVDTQPSGVSAPVEHRWNFTDFAISDTVPAAQERRVR